MRDVFNLFSNTKILTDDPYLASYPYLLAYFSQLTTISGGDVVRGAHMVYGWMPTIIGLNLSKKEDTLQIVADLLTKAKTGIDLSSAELQSISNLVNKSTVGASKLLHFVAPKIYPIWDSRVYRFVHEETPHHYRVNNISKYQSYLKKVHAIVADQRMPQLQNFIDLKLGYTVSAVRAVELVMFSNAPPSGA